MNPARERTVIVMWSALIIALSTLLALTPLARAESLPATLCNTAGDFGVFSGAIGCPASGASTSVHVSATSSASSTNPCASCTGALAQTPQFNFGITGTNIDYHAIVPSLAASTSEASTSTTIAGSIPISSPIPLSFAACRIKIIKNIIGGSATSSDFSLHLMQSGTDIAGSPQAGSASGTLYQNLDAGIYQVSERGGPDGYAPLFSGDCDANGAMHLSLGESATCTLTNTFVGTTTSATTTPPSGGESGGTSPGTGSGGGTSPSGGGPPSSSGGGGGGNPSSTSTGGGNGPVVGLLASGGSGGESSAPASTGASNTIPGSAYAPTGTSLPGIPNTGGGGGDLPALFMSGAIALAAAVSLGISSHRAR